MAAVDGIAAGKGRYDLVEIRRVGTTTKIFDAAKSAVQFFYEPFEPKDMEVGDRAYAKFGETRRSL